MHFNLPFQLKKIPTITSYIISKKQNLFDIVIKLKQKELGIFRNNMHLGVVF